MTRPVRPERGAALEMDALLERIERLAAEGDRRRYDSDDEYRWLIHRLWIAWRALRLLRNEIAHVRLPDIDEDTVWRMTALRPASLRERLRALPF